MDLLAIRKDKSIKMRPATVAKPILNPSLCQIAGMILNPRE
jgi:hypothetical protein